MQWNAGSTNQSWYAYDASGSRTLARSITSSGTSLTVYVFGLEEHVYNGTGSNVSNTYYYMLGGRLIGKFDGTNTQYYLTDAQGSVLTTFSNAATTTSVSGYQTYGPYGNKLASSGTMGTSKGYTGQYNDPTGLDYYNARYYDPVIGCFTSADTVQGNAQGMDPYSYVNGNPETLTDPTGQVTHCHEYGDCGPGSYTTDVGGGDTGSGSNSGSWGGDPGTCDASCQGPIHIRPAPLPKAGGGGGGGSGNPKIVISQRNLCSAKCQAEKDALNIAKNAADRYQTIANWLGGLAITLGLIDTALFAASFWAPVLLPWALLLAGIAAGIGMLSYKASEISHLFSEETANDLLWFTRGNVDGKRNQMLLTLVGLTIPSIGSQFILSKIGSIVEQSIKNSPELLKDLTPSLSFSVGGGSFALTDVIGTGILAGLVVYDTDQQKKELP